MSSTRIPFILLAEDNEQDQILTIKALKKNKLKNDVHVARDGEEALDFLFCRDKFSSRPADYLPELILLDLKLPKIDGLEVLKQIRSTANTKFIPVVILTTSNEDNDVIAGYESGANSYVRKPVDFFEFTEAVRNLGTYWLLLNERAPITTK